MSWRKDRRASLKHVISQVLQMVDVLTQEGKGWYEVVREERNIFPGPSHGFSSSICTNMLLSSVTSWVPSIPSISSRSLVKKSYLLGGKKKFPIRDSRRGLDSLLETFLMMYRSTSALSLLV